MKRPAAKRPVKRPAKKTAKRVTFSKYTVIRKTLDIAGKFSISERHPDVPELELNANLDYTESLRAALELELDRYVKSINSKAGFDNDDMDECETVQDVVDKTKEKLDKANEKV